MYRKFLMAAVLTLTLSATYAQAGVRFNIGISLPIFAPPPRPVYVVPRPVYMVPAPAPVYVQPAPVYIQPAPPPVYVPSAPVMAPR